VVSHEGRNIGSSVFENRTLKEVTGYWENYLMRNFIFVQVSLLVPVEWAA
jgi:hypothetical protein